MQPLEIRVEPYGEDDEILANIAHSRSLGLQELTLPPCAHDGVFVIVGSSPSVVDQVENIYREKESGRPICAINGGHDFLIEQGITPDLFLTVDPRPMPQNFKHANAQTVYLLASRCHPSTFTTLEGRAVLLWHSWSDNYEQMAVEGLLAIGGGTTSGLRAINVAYCLGFRSVHLYGMDSCLGENKQKRWDDAHSFTDATTDVIVGGRQFWCNYAMAQQANEFQTLYDVMPDMHIESFGDGLICAIIDERRKQGLHT